MKKIYLLTLVLSLITVGKMYASHPSGFDVKMDDKARVGLFLAFSGVDSKVEDDNVILEIYDQCVWLTNKTDKTLYLNLAECFVEVQGESYNLYRAPEARIGKKTTKNKDKNSQTLVTDDQWFTIAPGAKNEPIATIPTGYYGTYSVYDGKDVRILNDITRTFMQLIDELRIGIEKGANFASMHFTQDESFTSIKASLSYRFSSKQEEGTSIAVETWLSDMIMSKYYTLFPEKQEKGKERSLAAKKVNPAMSCVGAKQPFEYDEEKSPIIGCDVTINLKKGQFTLGAIPTSRLSTNFSVFWQVLIRADSSQWL